MRQFFNVLPDRYTSWLQFIYPFKDTKNYYIKAIHSQSDMMVDAAFTEIEVVYAKAKAFDELAGYLPEETVKEIIEQYNNLSK